MVSRPNHAISTSGVTTGTTITLDDPDWRCELGDRKRLGKHARLGVRPPPIPSHGCGRAGLPIDMPHRGARGIGGQRHRQTNLLALPIT